MEIQEFTLIQKQNTSKAPDMQSLCSIYAEKEKDT